MEGFQSACPPLVLCAPAAAMAAAPGGVCWAKRETRFVTPRGLNYLELCKAILAQAGPATVTCTRECGVQVNAKVDKTVQCSLGPKTLLGQGEGDRLQSEEEEEEEEEELCVGGQASCTPPPVSQFFLTTRPVSIYSRVFDRRESREKAEVREQEGEEGGEHPDDDHKPPVHQDNKGSNLQVESCNNTGQKKNVAVTQRKFGVLNPNLSFWSRSTASSTAKSVTSGGRVLTCGASLEPTRCTTSSSAGSVKLASTPTEWNPLYARAARRRAASARRSRGTST
ncbi:ZAR1-like protein isoform X2 [Corythoichthys intestinalis]|uniref:ZAR1-like protein isoform X2 n=1 Tax=Corythoichthys intestinalis TaxID=161448 RepID=UPI0025A53BAE|nr:ZAR1-like protein isoform X2 [Corythoichthys intestinalis]